MLTVSEHTVIAQKVGNCRLSSFKAKHHGASYLMMLQYMLESFDKFTQAVLSQPKFEKNWLQALANSSHFIYTVVLAYTSCGF